MRSVFAYPGNMADAQHAALALQEAGVLSAFVTTLAYRPDGHIARLLEGLPGNVFRRLSRQLERRAMPAVDPRHVVTTPWWEAARVLASRVTENQAVADRLWDRMSLSFDDFVARRHVTASEAIHAYEYTALATFERAKDEGIARVLHIPSLDSRHFEEIRQREKESFPDLVDASDAYFDARFERRYERRRAEIALADVIVTNSTLTARSHIRAGAPASKMVAVPLAAPPPIAEVRASGTRPHRHLTVLWAGSLSIRKGAHYALDAWRLLGSKPLARLEVFGRVMVPERILRMAGDTVVFHGSVPQARLFSAYEEADILVFPTLSDGFGMVVTEALAHGLPVITTDQAGAADLVTSENGLLIPAADSRALADALRWCLDNRERLTEMRHGALQSARRRQWADYRSDLIAALDGAMRREGYAPSYALPNQGAGWQRAS